MAAYFSLRVPVLTLRVVLILTATLMLSSLVLLPFAFFSFNYFYNHLIPISTISLPFTQFVLNYDFRHRGPFIVLSENTQWPYASLKQTRNALSDIDLDLKYDITLTLAPHCQQYAQFQYLTTMYKISLMSQESYKKMDPYVSGYRASGWPVTHDRSSAVSYLTHLNTMILDCHRSPQTLKRLAPPLFQGFIPEVVGELEYTADTRAIPLLQDITLSEYINKDEPWCILLEFKDSTLVIDPRDASVDISISWKGLRYYLYHYRIVSYIVGVMLLWSLSTIVLFITIGGLIAMREMYYEEEDQAKEENEAEQNIEQVPQYTSVSQGAFGPKPVVLQGNTTDGFRGRMDNFDFTISVDSEQVTPVRNRQRARSSSISHS